MIPTIESMEGKALEADYVRWLQEQEEGHSASTLLAYLREFYPSPEPEPESGTTELTSRLFKFHLAGQHDQSSHGNWADPEGDISEAPAPPGTDPKTIRAWARKQGLEVGDRGRLHPDIVKAYLKAQKETTQPSTEKRTDLDAVRQWLRDRNYPVGDRGRIKAEWVALYDRNNKPADTKQPETTPAVEPASAFATRFKQLAAQMGAPETWFSAMDRNAPGGLDPLSQMDAGWRDSQDGNKPGPRAEAILNRVVLLGDVVHQEIASRLSSKGIEQPTQAHIDSLASKHTQLRAEFNDAAKTLDMLRSDMSRNGDTIDKLYNPVSSQFGGKNWYELSDEEQARFYRMVDEKYPGYSNAKAILNGHGEKIAEISKQIKDVEGNYSRAYAETAREVLNEIRPFGNKEFNTTGAQLKAMRQAGDAYPDEWVDQSNEAGRVNVGTSTRGWHSGGKLSRTWIPLGNGDGYYIEKRNSEIKIAKQPTAMEGKTPYYTNAVHEMGHRFEALRPHIKNLEWVMWNLRAKAASGDRAAIRALNRILPNHGYKADERAVSDDYVNAYMGKIYNNQPDANYELFTMGMESLFSGSYPIWKDQSYLNYILGILGAG